LNRIGDADTVQTPQFVPESIMPKKNIAAPILKQTLKEALAETLREQRDLLEEVFTQVVEDVALSRAIREGRKTKLASRQEVFKALRAPAL
jgi:hypothetical protein